MQLINTAADLHITGSPEQQAFLQTLLNDYTTFDDAEYPENYDLNLGPSDEGYVEPVIRTVWNAGAAAAWGFGGREQIEALIASV
jgi:hypothetical protein